MLKIIDKCLFCSALREYSGFFAQLRRTQNDSKITVLRKITTRSRLPRQTRLQQHLSSENRQTSTFSHSCFSTSYMRRVETISEQHLHLAPARHRKTLLLVKRERPVEVGKRHDRRHDQNRKKPRRADSAAEEQSCVCVTGATICFDWPYVIAYFDSIKWRTL
jgi:hypothetical protein